MRPLVTRRWGLFAWKQARGRGASATTAAALMPSQTDTETLVEPLPHSDALPDEACATAGSPSSIQRYQAQGHHSTQVASGGGGARGVLGAPA